MVSDRTFSIIVNKFIKDPNFIVTHGKPHKPAMKLAGIDTDTFKPHSCRSTSAAKRSGIPIDQILQQGNWFNPSTFYKFYSKEL